MQRICSTLAADGYDVTLVGRKLPASIALSQEPYKQKRLHCIFRKGFLFYAEFNVRLFWYLLFASYDVVCSIDLDTLAAGCFASLIRRKKRIFDAHEYFTEVPEVADRLFVKTFWEAVARICLPFYKHAYTVGKGLADIFEQKYHLHFEVVRNVPVRRNVIPANGERPFILMYQGALNEGRGIETMLEAMIQLPDVHLWLAGEGDLSESLRKRATALGLDAQVRFLGYVAPRDLPAYTSKAWLGINLLENRGLSYYYSLANKFFDYVQAGVPVITMNFPEYRALVVEREVGLLLDTLSADEVASAVRKLLNDTNLYGKLQQNCLAARQSWNWEEEKINLLEIYRRVI